MASSGPTRLKFPAPPFVPGIRTRTFFAFEEPYFVTKTLLNFDGVPGARPTVIAWVVAADAVADMKMAARAASGRVRWSRVLMIGRS